MCPAYNEEMTVGQVVKKVNELYPDYDLIVIDDGSTDSTVVKAKEAGASVISLPFHAGGTIAVLTGYLVAMKKNYDFLVKIDADGQHKPEDIARLLKPLWDHEADISVGSRYLMNDKEEDSVVKIGGRVFSSYIISYVCKGANITDTTSGFRAWNKKAITALVPLYLNRNRLPDDSVLWPVETRMAISKNLRIKEIPIKVLPRLYGKSKSFSSFKMLMYPFRLMNAIIETME
jgi:glycosyltransferase involved in cell wall biosynthesis